MPRKHHIPKHCYHRPSGRGYVRLAGRTFYTGPYGTPEAKNEYDRLVGEWLVSGRRVAVTSSPAATCVELAAAFWTWAHQHYTPTKTGASEADNYRGPLRTLKRLYGPTPVVDFGLLQLETIRQVMIEEGQKRTGINRNINRLLRVFRWGVGRDLVPAGQVEKLESIEPLRKGSGAAEPDPVKPVPLEHIDAVYPYVTRQVWP